MPSVLSINAGQDPAGIGVRLAQGFRRHSAWDFHSIARFQTYIDYPVDRTWDDAGRLWAAADVVHLHNNFATARLFEGRRKPSVIHHHGTMFRQSPAELLAETRERRAVGIASTLDLYLMAPDELVWVPAPYDVDGLARLRRRNRGRLRVVTAPTDRAIKSTDALIAACRDLPVDLVIVERADWQTCLREKATADIVFDQVQLGYGCNAIEAMAMGIPVIAGAAAETLAEYRRRFGSLPFHPATEPTIGDALAELIASPALRAEIGERGQRHARAFHDERTVTRQMEGLYELARRRFLTNMH